MMLVRMVVCGIAMCYLVVIQDARAQSIQPIYSFPLSPVSPFAGLIAGPDGNFYGTTWGGGSGGMGAVIRVTPGGESSTVYAFGAPTATQGTFITNLDGAHPEAALTLGPDGNLYGTTEQGGIGGNGTVFRVTTNGMLTTLHSFGSPLDGANPTAELTLGPDGNMYGTTPSGGTNGDGTIFCLTTNGALMVVHSFAAARLSGITGSYTNWDGEGPASGLALGADGNLYGTTSAGGLGGSGTLFRMTTNGVLSVFYTFSAFGYNNSGVGFPDTNSDGMGPAATLTLAVDGSFYGTTRSGGLYGSGTVFDVTTNGALTTLHTFSAVSRIFGGSNILYTNADGASPAASVTMLNGNLFGVARSGGSSGHGTLYEISADGVFSKLLTFTNGNGGSPTGTLLPGTNGVLYGMTDGGGSAGVGTVYVVTTNGALTTLVTFAEYHGGNPDAGLTLGPDGIFYGTTGNGGTNGPGIQPGAFDCGTVFAISTNGDLRTLVHFGNTNGANPEASLALGANGHFYGTTSAGGRNGLGSVFELTANGALTTLFNFTGTNGSVPVAGLILGTDGSFYGTTTRGGSNSAGSVFALATNGLVTTLYSFTNGNDGAYPYAGLALGTNGNFYGLCAYGGKYGYGTIFEVTNTGGFAVLYSFTNGADGANPYAGLTLGPNGNFYGTTAGDSSSTFGNIFTMTHGGALTTLYVFTNGYDSGSPNAALTLGPDGNFYGTTYGNASGSPYDAGLNPWGTVFEVTPNGKFSTLASFVGTNGGNCKGSLTLGPDGNFYGTTSSGGAQEIGEVFRLNLPPEIIQQPVGQSVMTSAPVTLSVTLFGTAPYSFQWLSNNIPILGATNSTFTVPNVAAVNMADYTVSVSNAWGSVSSSVATLAVPGVPVLSGLTVAGNRSVTLICQSLTNITSRLWATTNLTAPVIWTPIFTNTGTSSLPWQFTDTNGGSQQRYYRLSTP